MYSSDSKIAALYASFAVIGGEATGQRRTALADASLSTAVADAGKATRKGEGDPAS
jgi:hypothetical protein